MAISVDELGRIIDKFHVFVSCIHQAISVVVMVETLERSFCVDIQRERERERDREKGITLSPKTSRN